MKTIIKIDSIIDAKDKVECWKNSVWFLGILERSAFYVGITNDFERRLKEHNVDLDGHLYNVFDCGTDKVAKAAEETLCKLGYDVGERPGITGPATLKYRDEEEMIFCTVLGRRMDFFGERI